MFKDDIHAERAGIESNRLVLHSEIITYKFCLTVCICHVIYIYGICLDRITLQLNLKRRFTWLPGDTQKLHEFVGVDLDVICNESVFTADGDVNAFGFDDAGGRHAAGDDDVIITVEGS